LADRISREVQDHAVLLASVMGPKVILLAVISKNLVETGLNAVELVNVVAVPCGGRGGGRKEKAEAGGKEPEKLKVALQVAREWLKGKMS
jgi:alanyl-tRNA synthetase